MLFKVFVLLRMPISAVCLLGYGTALSIWTALSVRNQPSLDFLGVAFVLGVYIFLAVTSIKLFRSRKSGLSLALWLLALETIGAVLLECGVEYIRTQAFEPFAAFAIACVVILVWTLPNALVFYKARGKFTEDAELKKA